MKKKLCEGGGGWMDKNLVGEFPGGGRLCNACADDLILVN